MSVESRESKKPFRARKAFAAFAAPLALTLSACAPNSVEAVPGAQITSTATQNVENSPSFTTEEYKKYPAGTIDELTKRLTLYEKDSDFNTFNTILNEGLIPRMSESFFQIVHNPDAIDQVPFDWVQGSGKEKLIAQMKDVVKEKMATYEGGLKGYFVCPLPTDQGNGWHECEEYGYSSLMTSELQKKYSNLDSVLRMQGNLGDGTGGRETEETLVLSNYAIVQQADGGIGIEIN